MNFLYSERRIFGFLMGGALIYFGVIFNRGISVVDEGYVLHLAQMITHGRLPCRDFFYHAIPGSLYIQAGLLSLFGERLIAVRLYALLQALIFVWFSFRIARTFQRPVFACLSAALFIPWNILVFYRMAHYNVDSSFFAFCTLFFILCFAGRKTWPWLAAAGLSAGMTLICKQNVGAFTCLFALLAAVAIKKNNFSLWKRLIFVSLPLMLPLASIVIYFACQDALSDLYRIAVIEAIKSKQGWVGKFIILAGVPALILVFIYAGLLYLFSLWLKRAGKGPSLSRRAAWAGLIVFHAGIMVIVFYFKIPLLERNLVTGLLPVVLILLTLLVSWKDSGSQGDERISRNLTLIFVALFYTGGILSGVDFAHNLMGFCLAFVLLGYLLQFVVSRSRRRSWLAAAVFAFLLISGFLYPFTPPGVLIFHDPLWLAREKVNLPQLSGIRVSRELKNEIEGIYQVVNLETAEGEAITVLPFGGFYYFITRRPPASFRTFLYHDIFPPSQQAKLIDEIERAGVKLVLMPAREKTEFGAMLEAGYLREVYGHVYKHFMPVAQYGRYEVYLRKGI